MFKAVDCSWQHVNEEWNFVLLALLLQIVYMERGSAAYSNFSCIAVWVKIFVQYENPMFG